MKSIIQVVVTVSALIFSTITVAKDCTTECQINQVTAYFQALDKVAQKGSTVEDIDALLALMHDDVKYIHVEYQANFDKATWRKAFIRNLNRGFYQNDSSHEKRVLNKIYGKNHVAIEYARGIKQADGSWQQEEPLLALFGFTDGKISLVKELW